MVTGRSDKVFNAAVYLILVAVAAISLFPLLYVVSMSLTPTAK
ncbi:hypothetical protein HMSSN036_27310 [Paenibacillus macerans]|nr:hypothetical protein HMSSN036_27310 [Paenibacillus macerans]